MKTALVTGAARGIGAAFAEAYLREGAQVAIADIDFDRAQETATSLGSGQDAAEQLPVDRINGRGCHFEQDLAFARRGDVNVAFDGNLLGRANVVSAANLVDLGGLHGGGDISCSSSHGGDVDASIVLL